MEGGIGIPPYLARFYIQFLNGSFCHPLLFFLKAIHDIIGDVFIVYKKWFRLQGGRMAIDWENFLDPISKQLES